MDDINNISIDESRQVIKRSGEKVLFEPEKIKKAILKAMESVGKIDDDMADKIARLTTKGIFRGNKYHVPHVDEIHDMVENKLMDNGLNDVAKEYIIYRSKHQPNIFTKRTNLKPYEYPNLVEYVDAIRHSYWVHTEFNFTSDIQDFKVPFNSEMLKIILSNNKDANSAIMSLNTQGLLKLVFLGDNWTSTYYMVRKADQ